MNRAPRWQIVELTFTSQRNYPNPYLEVDAVVTFCGPEGAVLRRPAFWDGGHDWRVRFAPTQLGMWRYEVASNDPADRGLNAIAGEIECVGTTCGLCVYEHGFLRSSRDGRHLEHADGTPFFWLGDTHWRLAWERWDESNKPGWPSQFRGMVDRRVAQGFSVYQTNLMSFDSDVASSPLWVTGEPFKRLHVDYMREVLDPRMAYIANAGLVNAIGLAWFMAIDDDVAGMVRFARYVVARYGAYPVVWTLGGEAAGYDRELRQARIDGWREVALAIGELDAYDHPRTAHLTTERPIASYYQGEDWLTLTLNQLGHGDLDLSAIHYRDHVEAYPHTPLVEGESMYEGLVSVEYAGRRTVTDTMVRQVAYRAIQSGCCGYTYGAQGCWNAAWDTTDHATSWGDLPWFEGIDLKGGEQLGHLRRFYESIDWTALRPEPSCFVTENAFNVTLYRPDVTADSARRTVVAYFGETYRRSNDQAALEGLSADLYRLSWFDPRTGCFHPIGDGPQPPRGGVVPIPDKPDDRDWLLLAEAAVPEGHQPRPALEGPR